MKETKMKNQKNVGAGLDQPEKENVGMKNVGAGSVSACKESGITLIALIITIIVMLILVAVSIQVLFNTGLFDAAGKAVQKWDTEQEKEANMQLTIGNKVYGSVEDYINGKEDLEAKEQALKEKLAQETGNSAIDEEGNIVDISLWRYRILSEEEKTCEIYGYYSYYGADSAYKGNLTDDGELEENIPMFIKVGDTIYTMTSIGDYSFFDYGALRSISIPNSVTNIGTQAFYIYNACLENGSFVGYGLESVEIPSSVTSIGDYAFWGTSWYHNLEGGLHVLGSVVYCYKGSMPENTSIAIEEGITMICAEAFDGCSGLISIEIPASVASIGSYAFRGCSSLTSIEIPDSVTSIEAYTFQDCSGLTSVIIPNSVTSIGYGAFSRCSVLTTVYYTGTEEQWNSISINGSGNSYLTNAEIVYNYTGTE